MNPRAAYALAGLGLFFVQMTFVPLISIAEFQPDLMTLWLVTIGIRRGQIDATVAGFAAGLMQDAVTTQMFGLAALSKTSAGFLAGYFYNETTYGQTLGSYRFLVTAALVGAVQNVIYYGIFFQGLEQSILAATARAGLGMTLYTTIIAVLPMFAFARSYRTQWTQ